LQTIPSELNEAARVDGASGWGVFRHITFPLLMPISITIILIRGLEAFKVIDIIRVVTGGGPGQATESVTLLAYDLGIKNGDIGYAASIAFTLLFAAIVFGTIFLAIGRRVTPTQE
jgi:multiple sugar transport system permease protein